MAPRRPWLPRKAHPKHQKIATYVHRWRRRLVQADDFDAEWNRFESNLQRLDQPDAIKDFILKQVMKQQ